MPEDVKKMFIRLFDGRIELHRESYATPTEQRVANEVFNHVHRRGMDKEVVEELLQAHGYEIEWIK